MIKKLIFLILNYPNYIFITKETTKFLYTIIFNNLDYKNE